MKKKLSRPEFELMAQQAGYNPEYSGKQKTYFIKPFDIKEINDSSTKTDKNFPKNIKLNYKFDFNILTN